MKKGLTTLAGLSAAACALHGLTSLDFSNVVETSPGSNVWNIDDIAETSAGSGIFVDARLTLTDQTGFVSQLGVDNSANLPPEDINIFLERDNTGSTNSFDYYEFELSFWSDGNIGVVNQEVFANDFELVAYDLDSIPTIDETRDTVRVFDATTVTIESGSPVDTDLFSGPPVNARATAGVIQLNPPPPAGGSGPISTDSDGVAQFGFDSAVASFTFQAGISEALSGIENASGTQRNIVFSGDASRFTFDNPDTLVVPEPAALGGLFGIAALLIARRRIA